MKCEKCNGRFFSVEKRGYCDDCKYNSASDEIAWKKGFKRMCAIDNEECWGGCYLMVCKDCQESWKIVV